MKDPCSACLWSPESCAELSCVCTYPFEVPTGPVRVDSGNPTSVKTLEKASDGLFISYVRKDVFDRISTTK